MPAFAVSDFKLRADEFVQHARSNTAIRTRGGSVEGHERPKDPNGADQVMTNVKSYIKLKTINVTKSLILLVPQERFELPTLSLRMRCSTN
jgi:hypothetical protein